MKLPYRITVLGSFSQELKEFISAENFHKYLFIYCNKYACSNFYDFVPQVNMPYCFTALEDRKWVEKSDPALRFAKKLVTLEQLSLQKFKKDLEKAMWSDGAVQQVWDEYFRLEPIENDVALYTIGYESLSVENYLSRLLRNNVVYLCDVRRNPYSQKYGFSKGELSKFLSMVNIEYLHIPELGIASSLRQDLKSDADYYSLLKQYEVETLPNQQKNIALLENLLEKNKRIAITCFEAKVSSCHRSKIANLMSEKKYIVRHV